jgi:hypothetical protein
LAWQARLRRRSLVRVAHSHGLTDEEYAAIRALQEAGAVPSVTSPVWEYLLSVGLVRVDTDVRPATVRLTAAGRSYPTD